MKSQVNNFKRAVVDLDELVGNSVQVTAIVEKIVLSRHSNSEMILLSDVYVNNSYFKDHSWVKRTKRLSVLSDGDKISANATLVNYHCSNSGKRDKLGLKSFRSVYIIKK